MQKDNAGDTPLKPSNKETSSVSPPILPASPLKPLYKPADTASIDYSRELGDPGQWPFTRGIHPEMYRTRLWTMRQYSGYGTAEESNRRFHHLLSQGLTGLSIAFDLPTQIGLDSDDALSRGEVGRVGVSIDSLEDMERLLAGIPIDRVSASMTINAPASVLLCMYYAVARRRGISGSALHGTIQNDILKEYIARGTYIFPPKHSLRLIADTFAFCARELPEWNPISISGYHIREAGATAEQEIAFTLANAVVYAETALAAGLVLEEFAPRFSFFFASHNDLFEEVAKFRTARKVWSRLLLQRFGCSDPACGRLRFHAQTAGSTLTAQQPENNVVRVAYQALAAILGGAQSLHTNSRDEALALPNEASATLALRTQQILACETGVPQVADPLGGSYLIEWLTQSLEAKTWKYLEEIESRGGMLRAVESGYVQREIQAAAYLQQQRQERGETCTVGVNCYAESDSVEIPLLRISDTVERDQIARLRSLRERRDRARAEAAIAKLALGARSKENLLYPILEAVEASVTVGEIVGALKTEFHEHSETVVI